MAPTGTISFMMDCDTTGIEPDIALVKYKQLAGGGMLKIVNQTVPLALRTLGYDEPQIDSIIKHIDTNDTIEGASESGRTASSGVLIVPLNRPMGFAVSLGVPMFRHDGGRTAVSFRCDLQNSEYAGRDNARGDRRGVSLGMEVRTQGVGHLSGRLQTKPAAFDQNRR